MITADSRHNGYFVDLFVRTTNAVAIGMYEQFGYSVYRRVLGYYHSSPFGNRDEDEDAFGMATVYIILTIDMRKPLKRDKLRQSVRENGANFLVTPEQVVF
jgi:N-terminal acetyltransferase B complex catalytic subunit